MRLAKVMMSFGFRIGITDSLSNLITSFFSLSILPQNQNKSNPSSNKQTKKPALFYTPNLYIYTTSVGVF
jgi:hypothetical protein